jgi:2-dehydro-3-deoxygluconokinase
MPERPSRIAALGECMIEFTARAPDGYALGFGGDTLNTAVYLARLGVAVDYVTALGDDPFSERMVRAWREEGIGTEHVRRVPGGLPGLYIVDTDDGGERRFHYWRDNAPARRLFNGPDAPAFDGYSLLYLSGISLAIWGPEGRDLFYRRAEAFRSKGGQIAFDTNFRARLWPDREAAADAYRRLFGLSGIVFAGVDDLNALFGDADAEAALDRIGPGPSETVVKLETHAALVATADGRTPVAAEPVEAVRDTTAAGDSFAAAYLAARLAGHPPVDAARAGHRLAGIVIAHPGAIVPRAATQKFRMA